MPRFSDAPEQGATTMGERHAAMPSPDAVKAQFRDAMRARGIDPPAEIIADDEIHRCDTTGRHGENDAVYLLHLDDGIPAGGFQNWQDGIGWQNWHADIGRAFTATENAVLRRRAEADKAKRETDRAKRRDETAAKAIAIWEKAAPNPVHPYLTRKRVAAHGVRQQDRSNNLVVPVYGEHDSLVNLQLIDPAGEKRFLAGGRKMGCSFSIGDLVDGGTILVVEGFATGATAREATGYAVVIAFDAGNLLAVAKALRARYPGACLVFLADDDWQTDGNPGVTRAREAAAAVGGRVAVPEFGPDRSDKDTDFNDLLCARGPEGVKAQIAAALAADLPNHAQPAAPPAAGDAPAQEILPSQPEVSDAIETLTKQSEPPAILAVIEMIASARLGPLWEGPMLSRIKDLTSGQTIPALRAALVEAERRQHAASVPAQPKQVATATDWKQQIKLNKDNEPKQTMGNAFTALVNDQAWRGVLGFNEFTGMITLRAMPPWPEHNFKPRAWTDEDTRMATLWMQKAADIDIPSYIVFEGVATVAERYRFHPVREYFGSLKWDSTPRLDKWLTYYCGCDSSEYIIAIGQRWVISAVARVYEPGCKADCCLILEGDQGIGKSSAFRTLASPEWFTDEIADLGSKDAAMQMRGKLIIELAELDALGKAEVSRQKIYMSRTSDRFRPPYGKTMIEVLRQSVFAGSVNDNQYLKDPTGGRRFWGAWAKAIDLDALANDRDQLWAEAVYRYWQHATWYLETPELVKLAKTEQDARRETDAWESEISDWLRTHVAPNVSVAEVLKNALDLKDRAKWTRADQMRIGACLKNLGWKRQQFSFNGVREWRYVKPDHHLHQPSQDEVGDDF